MLDQCAAISMAPDREWSARCGDIVREAGIGESYPFLGIEDIARRVRKTPIQFLIVNYRVETGALAQTIAEVRQHHESGVKFMPIVVFTRDSSAATALHFLKMGCDDIITFPSTTPYLADRLAHHVGRKIEYVHAGDYFGLDRPNLRDGTEGDVSEHYTIHRDPAHGTKILAQNKKPARSAG
jgi:DNA-binding response OmpR family regulator